MANAQSITIEKMGDLILLAWKIGIVYFQVFTESPDEKLFSAIGELLPYERLVLVHTDRYSELMSEYGYRGESPVFGAATGGWLTGLTGDAMKVPEVVRFARRAVILPEEKPKLRESSNAIRIHGFGTE